AYLVSFKALCSWQTALCQKRDFWSSSLSPIKIVPFIGQTDARSCRWLLANALRPLARDKPCSDGDGNVTGAWSKTIYA
ncbi:hypothetical protein, partial [Pseudomonas syringae]|uniref:hypothetical protein n=1 Tax=Pseudomonas syringae TaxID=317 RepID=UPI001E63D443